MELGKAALSRELSEVAAKLLDYCAIDCTDPWACNTCPVWHARVKLEQLGVGVYLPETMATMEPEELQAAEEPEPSRVLRVIRGGRR
ncbi:hypothetical protein [Alicyclobacillus herbarius]|uniref:hypothetical protein n=1 Tax=Alicyclobacillus herbarius TaxID=122960 RepID=UPI00047CD36A|nr:hypothetical protein [Alicyclobacillus herbarius]